jgi:hypothetical protein
MGSQVNASCECGFQSSSLIGGGMHNFMTTCYFPCLCERCCDIVQLNLLSKKLRCRKCRSTKIIPFDDVRLCETKGKEKVVEWNMMEMLGRKLVLTNGNYKCPKCGEMLLKFSHGGLCWD